MGGDNSPIFTMPLSVSEEPRSDWAPGPRTMFLFVLAGLLVVGQMYVVLPMLVQIGASYEAAPATMATAATVFGLAYASGFLCAGPLSERVGPRALIVTGLLSSGILAMSLALATTPAAFFWLRGMQGFSSAMFLPSALSYAATRIRPDSRVLIISCITTSAFAAAPVLQAMAQLWVGILGWRGVVVLCGGSIAVLGLLSRIILLSTASASSQPLLRSFRIIPKLLVQPAMVALYVGSFVLLGGFVAMYVAITLSGPQQVTSSPAALFALRVSSLPAMIAILLLAPLLKRYSALGRVVFGFCVSALGAASAVFVTQSVVQLAIVLLVFVAAVVMTAPALVELISAHAEPDDRGVATALYGFSMFLGGSVGSHLVGQFGHMPFERLLLVIAAVLIAGAGLTVFCRVSATPH